MITYYNLCILLSKVAQQFLVQILTSHVFFHSITSIFHTTNVLQRSIINYGALLRLMLMENTLENGETVTATVEQVLSSTVKSRAGARLC